MDNTWATPLFFPPHAHGVDIAIEAGTKYLSGHSDLLLGLVSANAEWFPRLRHTAGQMAIPAGPEDVFLALRGLRTMELRLREAERQGLAMARWLSERPEVLRVLHPALPDDPGHAIWKRDFLGSSGLFSVILKPVSEAAVAAFLDGLRTVRPRLFLGRLRKPRHSVRLLDLSHRDDMGARRPGVALLDRPRGRRGSEGGPRARLRAAASDGVRPMRDFLIDTDTASDDAVAIIMALAAPDVRVLGLTTVAGNVALDPATRNALFTVEVCGSDAPVYKGAGAPLVRTLRDAHWFHGADGLGDHGYPDPKRTAESEHAVDAILRLAREHPGLTLVTLGPLTNIALALACDPSLAGRVGRCVVMGGAPCCEGNVTPAAEYNIWVDPEAARAVFRSRLPIEMVGWHVSRGASVLTDAEVAAIDALGTAKARFAVRSNSRAREAYHVQTGETGLSLADPTAMAVALDRSVGLTWSRHRIAIETQSELTRGMTLVDRLGVNSDPINADVWGAAAGESDGADVLWTFDSTKFKAMLTAALL